MQKQYYRYDKDGYFIEPVIADYDAENQRPEDVTDVPLPQPCYMPRFDGKKWIEEAPRPDVEDGEVATWGGEAKEWRVESKPDPPVTIDHVHDATVTLIGALIDSGTLSSDILDALPDPIRDKIETDIAARSPKMAVLTKG